MAFKKFVNNLTSFIGGHAIGNQDFYFTGIILRKNGLQAAPNIDSFVVDREYERDKRNMRYCH
jgi:hypothetical protein